MYNVDQYSVKIITYFLNKVYRIYDNYSIFLKEIDEEWVKKNIRNYKNERKKLDSPCSLIPEFYYNYRAETEFGEQISRNKILYDLSRYPYNNPGYSWREKVYINNGCKYRVSSVPFTGKSRSGYYNSFRFPKTSSEKRNYYKYSCVKFEYKFKLRRSPVNLPSYLDDKLRHIEKNWKKHRKHQWK